MPEKTDPKEFSKKVLQAMKDQEKMLHPKDMDQDVPNTGTTSGPRGRNKPELPRPAAVRTYERQETPEERQNRFLEKSRSLPKNPAMETPDERTQRYLRKSGLGSDIVHAAPTDEEEMKYALEEKAATDARLKRYAEWEAGTKVANSPFFKKWQGAAKYIDRVASQHSKPLPTNDHDKLEMVYRWEDEDKASAQRMAERQQAMLDFQGEQLTKDQQKYMEYRQKYTGQKYPTRDPKIMSRDSEDGVMNRDHYQLMTEPAIEETRDVEKRSRLQRQAIENAKKASK